MIYVGYQGIGKSTLAKQNVKYIDLESGNFWVDGERPEIWYKYYANIANHLSNQGKTVMTASHKIFRDYLTEQGIEFAVICPDLSLKDEWISRLQKRYNDTQLEKDYKALKNAEEMFETNIEDLSNEKNVYFIMNMEYTLDKVIDEFEQWLQGNN